MKRTDQIELAKNLIQYLQDYDELAKVQRKLKIENVNQKVDELARFVKENAGEL